MREILFRGKRVDTGEWMYGYFGIDDNKPLIAINKENGINGYFVYPDTVGQYTGMTANGKKIFEGDIIERYERGITEPHNLYPTEKAKVGWNNAFTEFRANIIDLYHEEENLGEFIQGCEIEVIGNIHDNPELLEVE